MCTIVVSLISCNNNRGKADNNIHAKYEINIDTLESQGIAFISSYFKSVTPIFLETTDDCLIRYIDAVQVSKDYIFILDRSSRALYTFNKDGKFMGKIGKVGSGPGEYNNISDFSIDKKNQVVYILDMQKSNIASYDFKGKYIYSIPLDNEIRGKSGHIQFVNGRIYLDYGFFGTPTEKDTPLLVEINIRSGKILKRYLSSKDDNIGFQLITFKDGSYFHLRNDETPGYIPSYSVIAYSISDNIEPLFQLKSKRIITKEDIQELDLSNPGVIADINTIMKVKSIRNIFEMDENLICEYLDGYAMHTLVYSKISNEAKLYDFFFDDLSYISTNNSLYHYFSCSDKMGLYAHLNINDLPAFIDLYKNGFIKYKFNEEQLSIINDLSEDSNPVFFYYQY